MITTETYGCDRHGEDAYQGCALCDLEALRSRLAEAEALLRVIPGYGLSAYDKGRWEKARSALLAAQGEP